MDLDLRRLRYFCAVAEHGHFGRAAQALFIAQPVLSRQIRALEDELGCALLTRTTRTVALTPAGEQLLTESRAVFAAVDAALRRTLDAGRGLDRLVVGFAYGLHVSAAVQEFTRRHPGIGIDLVTVNWWEQDAALRDGRVHVALLRRQFDEAGLRVIPVGLDPRIACLPAGHRLARRRSLTMAELDGEPVIDPLTRRISSVEEKFERVAAGEGIALVPRSVGRAYPHPGLVYRPVRDAPAFETCLALPAGQRHRRVLDFVAVARETLHGPAVAGGRAARAVPVATGTRAAAV